MQTRLLDRSVTAMSSQSCAGRRHLCAHVVRGNLLARAAVALSPAGLAWIAGERERCGRYGGQQAHQRGLKQLKGAVMRTCTGWPSHMARHNCMKVIEGGGRSRCRGRLHHRAWHSRRDWETSQHQRWWTKHTTLRHHPQRIQDSGRPGLLHEGDAPYGRRGRGLLC